MKIVIPSLYGLISLALGQYSAGVRELKLRKLHNKVDRLYAVETRLGHSHNFTNTIIMALARPAVSLSDSNLISSSYDYVDRADETATRRQSYSLREKSELPNYWGGLV
jgi:hypothetical protein